MSALSRVLRVIAIRELRRDLASARRAADDAAADRVAAVAALADAQREAQRAVMAFEVAETRERIDRAMAEHLRREVEKLERELMREVEKLVKMKKDGGE